MADTPINFRHNYDIFVPELRGSPREHAIAIRQVCGFIVDVAVIRRSALGVAIAGRIGAVGAGWYGSQSEAQWERTMARPLLKKGKGRVSQAGRCLVRDEGVGSLL